MLITIERQASCWMFARSCKHPISAYFKTVIDGVFTVFSRHAFTVEWDYGRL